MPTNIEEHARRKNRRLYTTQTSPGCGWYLYF